MNFEVFKALLQRIAEEVEAEIRRVEKELAEARRAGRRAEELSAIRDILREDRWFRIATAIYAQIKKEFAEDRKAAEVIEAAEKNLRGLRLEVIEAPLLKVEVAVDKKGSVTAVRCRAGLDVGVEAVFEGVSSGYKFRGVSGMGATMERVLEEVRREFSGLPVYVGVEEGYVYVKKSALMDMGQFRQYLETCRRLGFRFDRRGERWVKPLEELKAV